MEKVVQKFKYFVVVDFEACQHEDLKEITDFPAIIVPVENAHSCIEFHHYVKPHKIPKDIVEEYIRKKYGKMNELDKVWFETSLPFDKVLAKFEEWMKGNGLLQSETDGNNTFAIVTCGSWDIGRMLPSNCKLLGIEVPTYMRQWIDIKELFAAFYNRKRAGMKEMLQVSDDCRNITKILRAMLQAGALLDITGRTELDETKKESYSDFKVIRNDISSLPKQEKKKSESKKNVMLVSNATKKVEDGKVKEVTTDNFGVFLKQCSNKIGVKAKRAFLSDGTELKDMQQLNSLFANPSESIPVVYISSGEDFNSAC